MTPATAAPAARALLDKVERALGATPNMMRGMAASPSVLDAYLSFSSALGKGACPREVVPRHPMRGPRRRSTSSPTTSTPSSTDLDFPAVN